MAAVTLSLRSLFITLQNNQNDQNSFLKGNLPLHHQYKAIVLRKGNFALVERNLRLNCSRDKEMDVSTSALVDGVAECTNDEEIVHTSGQVEPSVSTMLMNFSNDFDPYEALSTPLYQTATFKQPSATDSGTYDYTRSGNPTRDALERLLAKLDNADRALCFTSGMAALSAVTHLVGTGDEIVAGDDMYGGSDRLLSQVTPKSGVVVKRVDTTNLVEVSSAISPNTKLVWLESPTNPRQQISDIRRIAELAHAHGALVMVDNSIMSPVLSQPLELGADIVMHSATKFIAGHCDLMGSQDVNADSVDNELFIDAMKEADIYGLQIIKNADLEELRELGAGAFGTVYHGKWLGTDVAIKRIKKTCFSGRASEQERLVKGFWREACILSSLHHPNVVAFYGVVPDGAGGTLATVAEFMANGSLRTALVQKDKLLDHRKKLIIAMAAAFGMEYLHSKNIVHFDLKCDNLLVNLRDPERPICKVGDFGLSKIKKNTLVSGGLRGTIPWMAPELLNGSTNRVSEKVDVFSFGIVLWEILTGEEPYANMHIGSIIGGIVKNTLRPVVPEWCDPDWRKLMEQCWSADSRARPSFTEIACMLRSMSSALQAKDVTV